MQHSPFSSSFDEKRALRVSTKPCREVRNSQQLARGVQGLFCDLDYSAVTEILLASVQPAGVIGAHMRGGLGVAEQFNVEISRPSCHKSMTMVRQQR